MRIIISRTDSIGDVILTLPLAGFIKSVIPTAQVIFAGRSYTHAVIKVCPDVDDFLDVEQLQSMSFNDALSALQQQAADTILHVFPNPFLALLAKKAGIKNRVGTSHRIFHLFTCNKLVNLGRKKSNLHETALNFKLLEAVLGHKPDDAFEKYMHLNPPKLSENLKMKYIVDDHYNLIIHPKSKGSAREWPFGHYRELIFMLQGKKVNLILTGTQSEGETFLASVGQLPSNLKVTFGQLNLSELISLIGAADGLLACSTGPLHIAAALGKDAMGIYPPIKPMHPGRWAPIGTKTKVFCLNKSCNLCRKQSDCRCIQEIQPSEIYAYLENIIQMYV